MMTMMEMMMTPIMTMLTSIRMTTTADFYLKTNFWSPKDVVYWLIYYFILSPFSQKFSGGKGGGRIAQRMPILQREFPT